MLNAYVYVSCVYVYAMVVIAIHRIIINSHVTHLILMGRPLISINRTLKEVVNPIVLVVKNN